MAAGTCCRTALLVRGRWKLRLPVRVDALEQVGHQAVDSASDPIEDVEGRNTSPPLDVGQVAGRDRSAAGHLSLSEANFVTAVAYPRPQVAALFHHR